MFFDYLSGADTTSRHAWDSCGMSFGRWSWSVPDTAGTASNLLANVDNHRRAGFVAAARVTRDAFEKAARAHTADFGWKNYLEARFRGGMKRL